PGKRGPAALRRPRRPPPRPAAASPSRRKKEVAAVHDFWGWQVVVDIFLGGLAAGVMIVSVVTARQARSRAFRMLPFIAPAAISVALFALFLDLGNKLHAFRF